MRNILILTFIMLSLSLFAKDRLTYIELITNNRIVYQFNYYEGKKLMKCVEFVDTIVNGLKVRTIFKKTLYYYDKRKINSTKTIYYYPIIKIKPCGVYIHNTIKELNTIYKY